MLHKIRNIFFCLQTESNEDNMRNKLGFLILLTCLSMNNGTAAETAEVKVVSGHPRIMMLAGE